MGRKQYSELYKESKRPLQEAIKRLEQEDPKRFKELQERAKYELEHPPERPIIRHTVSQDHFGGLTVDEFIRKHHTQDYNIYTKDCWEGEHLYFESLNGETAESVLTKRHPKFTERKEKVTWIEPCRCPLCKRILS